MTQKEQIGNLVFIVMYIELTSGQLETNDTFSLSPYAFTK